MRGRAPPAVRLLLIPGTAWALPLDTFCNDKSLCSSNLRANYKGSPRLGSQTTRAFIFPLVESPFE
jgi:hypothetical protein